MKRQKTGKYFIFYHRFLMIGSSSRQFFSACGCPFVGHRPSPHSWPSMCWSKRMWYAWASMSLFETWLPFCKCKEHGWNLNSALKFSHLLQHRLNIQHVGIRLRLRLMLQRKRWWRKTEESKKGESKKHNIERTHEFAYRWLLKRLFLLSDKNWSIDRD